MTIQTSAIRKQARAARIAHVHEKGLHATIVKREGLREFHITVEPLPGDSAAALVERLHAFVTANQAQIVRQEMFGTGPAMIDLQGIQTVRFGSACWPVTCVEALSCAGSPIAGLHILAISGPEIAMIEDDGRTVGSVFSDGFAKYCILGGVLSSTAPWTTPQNQTLCLFEEMARHLRSAGLGLTHMARTWLFLDDILGWYDVFNRERREAFDKHDLFSHCVPASTGIGAPNPYRAALIAGAWAVQAAGPGVTVQQVQSPLQCSARDYGSCFSRAVEITTPDLRRLLISGTASIAPDGHTEHVGDIGKQVALTFDVVEAILTAQGMGWQNTSRATVYVKHARDASALARYLAARKLMLPTLVTEAYVCRDDLLFELEIDALLPAQNRFPLL